MFCRPLTLIALSGLFVGTAAIQWIGSWEVNQPAGILVSVDPIQSDSGNTAHFQRGKYEITPLAKYEIRARLLSKMRYRFDDGAAVAPWDLALGWGSMSRSEILDRISIKQGHRWVMLSWDHPPGISDAELWDHIANTHSIPATPEVMKTLSNVRVGQLLHLQGFLVTVTGPQGWTWTSSISRTDRGAGACELMWIESAKIER